MPNQRHPEGVRRVKVYTTPQEAVQDMVPPGCKFVLNHGDHRFTTNWVGPTRKIPAELMNKSFSRSFCEQKLERCPGRDPHENVDKMGVPQR